MEGLQCDLNDRVQCISKEGFKHNFLHNTGPSSSKLDEAKQQREERRLQRQREIEAKRAARAGPMKLGARRI